MKNVNGWVEISLSLPREQAALAEALLEAQGALAVTLQDHADVAVLEPALGTAPLWPVVHVRGLFEPDISRGEVSASLLLLPGVSRPQALTWCEVADQDWERAWMDLFQPMQFGRKLWIVPSGMQGPVDNSAIILHIDPGLAFGTGTHPTTALCLEWIDGHDFGSRTVVDYGCGSGVLGIAAALKGATRVVCVDYDPQALEATRENALRNDVIGRINCQAPNEFLHDALHDGQADVVLANILAGPLIQLAPVLLDCLRPGGRLVLSGVLAEQAGEVAQAYHARCGEMQVLEKEGWVRLVGTLHESGEV